MSRAFGAITVTILAGTMVASSAIALASQEEPQTNLPQVLEYNEIFLAARENAAQRVSRSQDREEVRFVEDKEEIRRINERIRERRQERREARKEARQAARQAARQEARRQARIDARQEAAQAASNQSAQSETTESTGTTSTLTGVWRDLAMCESGLNPRAYNSAGYYGLFQFDLGTWQAVGGSGDPRDASVSEQLSRAQTLQARSGWGPWPSCASQLGLL